MKKLTILCEYSSNGPHFVRSGWKHVFEALGHRFVWWNPQRKSAFDAFSENDPVDIFLGTTYGVDRAVYKNIVKRPEMKVALFASAWGPYLDDIDLRRYPLVVASETEKRIIESLRKETGKPNFVFIHAHDRWLDGTMSRWASIGVPYIGLLNAADLYSYLGGKFRPELSCDWCFVGSRWDYKSRNLDRFLLPLCHPSSGLTGKIFANSGGWPVSQYLGSCSDEEARDLFASATVCPNVSEPHSTDLSWDFVERPYKTMLHGFCISDYVEEGRDLFSEEELIMCNTPADFEATVKHFVRYPEDRKCFMESGRKKVLSCHTYHHRIAKMLKWFGLDKLAEDTMKLHEQYITPYI